MAAEARTFASLLREMELIFERRRIVAAENDAKAERAAQARLAATRMRIAGKLNVIGDLRKEKVLQIIDARVRVVERIERDPRVARATIDALRDVANTIMEDWDR